MKIHGVYESIKIQVLLTLKITNLINCSTVTRTTEDQINSVRY